MGLEQREPHDEGERDDVGGEHGGLLGHQAVRQPAEDPGGEDGQVGIGDVVSAAATPGPQQLGEPRAGREQAGQESERDDHGGSGGDAVLSRTTSLVGWSSVVALPGEMSRRAQSWPCWYRSWWTVV